jgi:carbon storage regulator
MLVLSRKPGESVVLTCGNQTITVTFVDQRGGKIRLGFIAPEEVGIWREELVDQSSEASKN